nr:MAG TPA: hypothetical protein [Caudoviricetes sp.]
MNISYHPSHHLQLIQVYLQLHIPLSHTLPNPNTPFPPQLRPKSHLTTSKTVIGPLIVKIPQSQ